MERLLQLHDLIVRTIGHRSTKHLSHIQKMCPLKADSLKVGREVMYEINNFYDFSDLSSWFKSRCVNLNWKLELEDYESSISKTTFPDHVNPVLEDNFVVDLAKTFESQKDEIRNRYGRESIPGIMLSIVEKIENQYGQSTQDSSKVAVNLLNKLYPWMQARTGELIQLNINPEEASRMTFDELNESLIEILSATELPIQFISSGDNANLDSLLISDSDREGLMMISRLQERPFDLEMHNFAQKLLNEIPALKSSLLVFHKLLVDYGKYRLSTIPGREQYTLVPFEEIFLLQNGVVVPNIRFMKILTTNWVPAIAQVLRNKMIDSPNMLEASHISEAIQEVERQHKLFQLTLFMFNEDVGKGNVMYGGHIPKVCPAKKMLSQVGIELLPAIYDKISKGDMHE